MTLLFYIFLFKLLIQQRIFSGKFSLLSNTNKKINCLIKRFLFYIKQDIVIKKTLVLLYVRTESPLAGIVMIK